MKKTGEEWQATDEFKDVAILDADGWRDGTNFYTDKLTKEEFKQRKTMCTCSWNRKRNQ